MSATARDDDPDVLLDVPALDVESLRLHLEDLGVRVALGEPNVGVDLHLGKVELDLKGVEARALVKLRLEDVTEIMDRLSARDDDPGVLEGIGHAVGKMVSGHGNGNTSSSDPKASNGAGASNGSGAGGRGHVAKLVAKTVAKEVGTAATDEAKELGLAATRKVKELGERRRLRLAEKHNATPAAMEAAEELGVDLGEVDGSGADGRITVRDVREAAAA